MHLDRSRGPANRRGAPRSHFLVTGRARRVGSQEPFEVGVTSLSRTGMRVECLSHAGAEIVPSDRLHVVLFGEGEPRLVELTGKVVWDGFVKGQQPWLLDATGETEGHWKFGVQFDHETLDIVRRLKPRPGRA